MAAVSLSDAVHVMKPGEPISQGFTLDMYKYVINDPRISTAYLNTLLYVVTGTAVSMAITWFLHQGCHDVPRRIH